LEGRNEEIYLISLLKIHQKIDTNYIVNTFLSKKIHKNCFKFILRGLFLKVVILTFFFSLRSNEQKLF